MEPLAEVDVQGDAAKTIDQLKGLYGAFGLVLILCAVPTLILRRVQGPIVVLSFWNSDAWFPVGMTGLSVGALACATALGLHRQRRWALWTAVLLERLCIAWLVSWWSYCAYVVVRFQFQCLTDECQGYWRPIAIFGSAWTAATAWAVWRCGQHASVLRQASLVQHWR